MELDSYLMCRMSIYVCISWTKFLNNLQKFTSLLTWSDVNIELWGVLRHISLIGLSHFLDICNFNCNVICMYRLHERLECRPRTILDGADWSDGKWLQTLNPSASMTLLHRGAHILNHAYGVVTDWVAIKICH